MAITSARILNLKEGHFEPENGRIAKYTLADELPAQLSQLALRPRAMEKPAYTIKRLGAADKGLVLKFLRRFFFRDEPMNQAANLLETPESRCLELEDYAASTLEEGVSVAAVDDENNLVGVIINGIARREEVDYTDKSEECPNPKFKNILKVLNYLDREAKVWDHIPESCNTVIEIRIASTHSDWRGRGLMRVLCEETEFGHITLRHFIRPVSAKGSEARGPLQRFMIESAGRFGVRRIGLEIGACAARMDTTSAFSAAAAERLRFKKIFTVMYRDLSYAPQPDAPHTEARVYIKEL